MSRAATRWQAVIFAGVALAWLLPVAAAQAVVPPSGCKFSTSSLKWKSATSTASYSQAATSAADSWTNTLTPIVLTLVTTGANIAVADANFGPTVNGIQADGITWTSLSPGGTYGAYCASDGLWTTGVNAQINRYYADGYIIAKKQSVLAHEIGHALGLAHYTAASCTNIPLMYPSTDVRYDTCLINTPHQGDVDGINNIY